MKIEELKKEISRYPPEEQKKKLEELISKLSPEQLNELKKQECILCQISSKKIKSFVIYEDLNFTAVLDIVPANLGHIILFPKQHITLIEKLDDRIFTIAKNISIALSQLTGNVNIIMQLGVLAGQKGEHLLINIIPRTQNDNVNINWQGLKISEADLESVREKIISKLPEEEKEENLEGYTQKERLP